MQSQVRFINRVCQSDFTPSKANHVNRPQTKKTAPRHSPLKMLIEPQSDANVSETTSPSSKSLIQKFSDSADGLLTRSKIFFQKNITRQRRKCFCEPDLEKYQSCCKAKEWLSQHYRKEELGSMQRIYQALVEKPCPERYASQIDKDVARTYPDQSLFRDPMVRVSLGRVLRALTVYDLQVGYVQGINYLAGCVLFHADETDCFFILLLLFRRASFRDNYLPNFPGLPRHFQRIGSAVDTHLPILAHHFQEQGVQPVQYALPWVLGLFTQVMPLQHVGLFIDAFLKRGWCAFDGFLIELLKDLQQDLLQEDQEGILVVLSSLDQVYSEKSGKGWERMVCIKKGQE